MAKKTHLLFLDFETYYDNDYSLRKMPIPNYILDDRYETIMVACKADDGDHHIVDGPDFPHWLAQYDPAITTTVTFNALFDNSILAWRYGYVPSTMIDAMGMARALLGHELASFSLKSVADHLQLGSKGSAINDVKGMRRQDIKEAGLWTAFSQYALQDNVICEGIFDRLSLQMPSAERRVMDMVLRCAVQPRFQCDAKMLTAHLADVRATKQTLLSGAQADVAQLMSAKKFQELLEANGVVVEMKTTASGRVAPAFARTDQFMTDLQEHPDPRVQALAAARLGFKSTLEETRTEKLLSIAELPWAVNGNGTPRLYTGGNMPIPLRYGGAHTHRLSGDWGMNMQNLPADRKKDGKSKLRASLKAPPGHQIVVCDLGQIEARLCAWICRCDKLVDEFANGLDPYSLLATEIFGRPINRKLLGDHIEGFIGKTGILGLGYGCGKDNFHQMVLRSARTMEMDISAKYTEEIGHKAVEAYRNRYRAIPNAWYVLNGILGSTWLSNSGQTQKFGPVEISYGAVELPNGLFLRYADPRTKWDEGFTKQELFYRYGKATHRIYGAKLLENIVQALARVVVMNAALRIRDRGFSTTNPQDYFFCLQAHDELVFIVQQNNVDCAKKLIHAEMTRRPSWGATLPLTADVSSGNSYGEAK